MRRLVQMLASRTRSAAWLVAAIYLCLCSSALTQTRQQGGKLAEETLSASVRMGPSMDSDVIPRWCYADRPEYIFAAHQSVFRSGLDGAATKVADAGTAIDIQSLRCSRDGNTIIFLSAAYDRIFIHEGEQLSEYSIERPPTRRGGSGSLMSPDGSVFVLPSDRVLRRGPDVLKRKRVLPFEPDVFWGADYVFRRGSGNDFEVLSRTALEAISKIRFDPDLLIHEIVECGKNFYAYFYDDKKDRRRLERLSHERFRPIGALLDRRSEPIADIDSLGDACLVSTTFEDQGMPTLRRLIVLDSGHYKSADLRSFRLLNTDFVLSKDRTYALGFERDSTDREGGKVVLIHLTSQR